MVAAREEGYPRFLEAVAAMAERGIDIGMKLWDTW